MTSQNEKNLNKLIAGFAILKLLIHLFTNTNYGLHRDEFLYLAEGQHLAWGYMEVPPMIAFLAKIVLLFGDSVFMVRLFPTLIGCVTVALIGLLVKELGGKGWAITFACMAFILAPAFLRSNWLFQPVSFNQFFWFLSAFWMIRIVKFENPKYWYFLGITAGLGFLTKYSIVFYFSALIIAFLISSHRKWFATRYPYLALSIAFMIALPNLFWQYQHNFPVVRHMQELSETQLVNVDTFGFITDQFIMLWTSTLIWLPGLIFLLFYKKFKDYRFIGITFLVLILIILALSGKSYYTLGAYAMLFVFGGLGLELIFKSKFSKVAIIFVMIFFVFGGLPLSLPVLSTEKMVKYSEYLIDEIGLDGPFRWEDGIVRPLPQDYADMNGWEELAQKVSKVYHQLSDEEKSQCNILGVNYGEAGAINFYRKKYDLPEAFSRNSSFILWAPEDIQFNNQILIIDQLQNGSDWFESMVLVDSIENPYARENGYIYYRSKPMVDVKAAWKDYIRERKDEFNLD
jgi:hypothetical protein